MCPRVSLSPFVVVACSSPVLARMERVGDAVHVMVYSLAPRVHIGSSRSSSNLFGLHETNTTRSFNAAKEVRASAEERPSFQPRLVSEIDPDDILHTYVYPFCLRFAALIPLSLHSVFSIGCCGHFFRLSTYYYIIRRRCPLNIHFADSVLSRLTT